MEKIGKNKAKDPIQQKLRDHKDQWNAVCSKFISRLISFKKALNGRGDSKMGLPPSRIQDVLPSEISAFFNSLNSEFDKIFQSGNFIIKEQEEYSNARQKKIQERKEKLLAKPTLAFSVKSILEKQASNKATRLWSYLSSIFSADEYKQYRMGMLRASSILYKNLSLFRSKILEQSIDSIPDAMDMYMKIVYSFSSLMEHFNRLLSFTAVNNGKGSTEVDTESDGKEQEQQKNMQQSTNVVNTKQPASKPQGKAHINPVPQENKAYVRTTPVNLRDLKKDLASLIDIGMPLSVTENINNKLNAYDKENDANKKEILDDLIWEEYDKILHSAKKFVEAKMGKKLSEDFGSLQELSDELLSHLVFKKSNVDHLLIKRAGFLQWMKENIYKLTPFEMTSASKLEISEEIKKARRHVDDMMDVLENGIDVEKMKEIFTSIKADLDNIKEPLKILVTIHKDSYLSKNHNKDKKVKKDLLDMETERRIKRDINLELFNGR